MKLNQWQVAGHDCRSARFSIVSCPAFRGQEQKRKKLIFDKIGKQPIFTTAFI
jgi:hypothetical protein